ncbi:hypothetical protein AAVH_37089 [Aphelenchoides avenae]|nr:hypothetical protein AAVH_37089 [Aphelenchus avenae]
MARPAPTPTGYIGYYTNTDYGRHVRTAYTDHNHATVDAVQPPTMPSIHRRCRPTTDDAVHPPTMPSNYRRCRPTTDDAVQPPTMPSIHLRRCRPPSAKQSAIDHAQNQRSPP